ncbi:hypothetical protein RF11_06812 [Thelohanellus kitauei]|uniref:Uncharacterized protein n=1 Tax=Thelohanellus kitauei TaxID=669202 RepID=A0A0C2MVZ6_THEKT|nr:hypothetical protein RF11_06812 [Thelohanellus kitauei]
MNAQLVSLHFISSCFDILFENDWEAEYSLRRKSLILYKSKALFSMGRTVHFFIQISPNTYHPIQHFSIQRDKKSLYQNYGVVRTAFSGTREDPIILLCFKGRNIILISCETEVDFRNLVIELEKLLPSEIPRDGLQIFDDYIRKQKLKALGI